MRAICVLGSSEAKVKAAVPSATCATLSGFRQCAVGVVVGIVLD